MSPLELVQVPGIPAACEMQLSSWAARAGWVLSLHRGLAVVWGLLNTALLGAEGKGGTPRITPEGRMGPHTSGSRKKPPVVLASR